MICNDRRKFNLLVLGLGLVLAVGGTYSSAKGGVTIDQIGNPLFQVVDTHIYAAPTDSFPSLFPLHFPTIVLHDPPYDHEFSEGLALTGFAQGASFSVAEFTDPSAVHLGYILVPTANAPTGSSFDFTSGPIIPNNVFPISILGDVYQNGLPFELNAFNISLPAQAGADGRSHFIVENWENSSFAPPGLPSLVGDYEYRLTIRDANNNGYNVLGQFQVIPEPGSLGLVVSALLVCGLRRRG